MLNSEWSLVFFTSFSQLAAGITIAVLPFVLTKKQNSYAKLNNTSLYFATGLMIVALLLSFLHLNKPVNAIHALSNLKTSWLRVKEYYDSTMLSQITNTDYEGEISSHGDKVIIRTQPSVTIRSYEVGQPLETEFPTGGTTELLIDKGLYWQTAIDDVIEKQQDIDQMRLWGQDAAEQLKISLDSEVLAYIPANVAAENQGDSAGRISGNVDLGTTTAAISLTSSNVLEVILKLGQVLDEQNVPETGRFVVMPFWATTLLKLSDIKDASLTGDGSSPLRNGMVGRIDRFTVYNSNLLPVHTGSDDWRTVILAGHKDAATFATQLTKTEDLRSEKTFGSIMRGLVVYGYKMIKEEAMAVAYVK
ncbi:MAG: DmsC/YnfH family molybdoenzyme membrane anchor subunit [Bacteroidales bacterium]